MQDLNRFQRWKDGQKYRNDYSSKLLTIQSSSLLNQMQIIDDINLNYNSEAEKVLVLRRLIKATKFISVQKKIVSFTIREIHNDTNKLYIFQELAQYALYKSIHKVILECSSSMRDKEKFFLSIVQLIIKNTNHKDTQYLILKFIHAMKNEYQKEALKDLLPRVTDEILLNQINLIKNKTIYKQRSTKSLNKKHCIRWPQPPIEWRRFNPQDIILNNIEDYKSIFKCYRDRLSFDKNKPLCIYAVSNQYDHNGAILSNKTLILIKHEISELSKFYNVIPVIFQDKYHLDNKIGKYCKKLDTEIKLLFLVGHGSPNFFANIDVNNTKFNNLSSHSQIVLAACSTVGGEDVSSSIAYKIAENNNGTVVFATDTSVEFVRPYFDLSNGPQIFSLGAICHNHELKSYKIFVTMNNCKSASIL